MSQPAATKLLQQAEDALGVTLFERHPRGMAATAAGEVLVRYARTVLNDFSVAREEIAALQSGLQGSVRIGCVPGAVPQLVAPALVEYKRRHPQVSVSVTVDISNVIIQQLERAEVDLVFGRLTSMHAHSDYVFQALLEEALVAVVRNGHPLLKRSSLGLADLVAAHWVVQPVGSPQRTRFDQAIHEAGITTLMNTTETASTVVTTALLEVSDMVAVMPASLAEHYGRLGNLRALSLEMPIRVPPIYLITRKGRPLSATAAQFGALVLSVMK
ncbi:LysR family transcriptional regulator [Comamonas testosteroni]|uniref:LysR family transcriptional regulator n=2 Tax=Comamonas testosteroni TaxID=285 RepID=A0A096F8S8_COMTE|nr:LysR family transcriptional regulator [Comamonas testosteroni]